MVTEFTNPFRPGAGHQPPYLAGRKDETQEFEKLLSQSIILENPLLTGLRGVGKTVLLDRLKPLATKHKWLWVGTDLSESASISEERIALRLLTDLAVLTKGVSIESKKPGLGFGATDRVLTTALDYATLRKRFNSTPGLVSDKLKGLLVFVADLVKTTDQKGVIFAYDEAQNLADHAKKNEYPLSLLLDVFQSLQKQNIPFMLALAGLPTLFPKLVEARTFAERMFRVVVLDRLGARDSADAIRKPIEDSGCPVNLNDESVRLIVEQSAGYPYFIQFICREVYDAFIQGQDSVPIDEITAKLDIDFFSGRWSRATDRQRDLMTIIAELPTAGEEFMVHEIAQQSKDNPGMKEFSPSHVNQMLTALTKAGLVYKNRHGKYSFAVPLMNRFILRIMDTHRG